MMITPRVLVALGMLGAILGAMGSLLAPNLRTIRPPRQYAAPSLSHPATQRPDSSARSSVHVKAIVSFVNDRRAGIPLSREQEAAISREIDWWLREDPLACIEFLGKAAPALLDSVSVAQAISAVTGDNPTSRIVFAQRISNPTIQERTLRAAAKEIIEGDFAKAFSTISLVPQYIRHDLQVEVAEVLVANEGVRSLEMTLSQPDATKALFNQVLNVLSDVDPLGGLQAINDLNESQLSQRWGSSLSKTSSYPRMLQKAEPMQALAFLQKLPTTGYTIHQTTLLVAKILGNDPGKGVELLARYPNSLLVRTAALTKAIDGVLRDPLASASLVNSMPGERMRETAIRGIISEVRYTTNTKNIEAVARFVDALQDPLSKKVGQEALATRHVDAGRSNEATSSP